MGERQSTIRSSAKGPRLAGLPAFIRGLCWDLDLELEIEVDKGWWFETVRFKVSGDESKLRKFKTAYEQACAEYSNQ